MKTVRHRQQGFSLIELALVLAVMGGAIVSGFMIAEYAKRIEQGRTVGNYMLQMRGALIDYRRLYRAGLLALPTQCSSTTYKVGAGLAGAAPDLSQCRVKDDNGNDIGVRNGMQPTLAELRSLRLLGLDLRGRSLIETDRNRVVVDATGQAPADQFGFLIRRMPIGNNNGATAIRLEIMVFNLQPYKVERNLFASGARVGAALRAMEGRGYLSVFGGDGSMRNSAGMIPDNFNPIAQAGRNGPDGILAAYDNDAGNVGGNGGGDECATYSKRDGTCTPTDNWDFGNKNLTNIADLGANDITAKHDITAKNNINAEANISATGTVTAKLKPAADGLVDRGDGLNYTGGDVNAENSMTTRNLIVTNLDAQGRLITKYSGAVNHDVGNIVAAGSITANTDLRVAGQAIIDNHLVLNGVQQLGSWCKNDWDSFARQSGSARLMVCSNYKWKKFTLDGMKTIIFHLDPDWRGADGKYVSDTVWQVQYLMPNGRTYFRSSGSMMDKDAAIDLNHMNQPLNQIWTTEVPSAAADIKIYSYRFPSHYNVGDLGYFKGEAWVNDGDDSACFIDSRVNGFRSC